MVFFFVSEISERTYIPISVNAASIFPIFAIHSHLLQKYKMSEILCSVARLLNLNNCNLEFGIAFWKFKGWNASIRRKTLLSCRCVNKNFYYCVVVWKSKMFQLSVHFTNTTTKSTVFHIFIESSKISVATLLIYTRKIVKVYLALKLLCYLLHHSI